MQSYNTIYCNSPGSVTENLFYLICNTLSCNALQCLTPKYGYKI